jgi:fucose 4-O-acetylase-like acetyltransferase
VRSASLDKIRGLAIVAMMIDHAVIITSGPVELRQTIGRIALPLFFIVAGHLAHRLTWRHAWILGVGLLLPVFIPWLSTPNILVSYVLGAVALWACSLMGRNARYVAVAVVVVCLTAVANGHGNDGGYNGFALLALMVAGSLTSRDWFEWLGGWLWRPLAVIGRRPLTWYVGHLALFELIRLGMS